MLRFAMVATLLAFGGFLTGCCSGPCGPCGGGGCGVGGYADCGSDCGGCGADWAHREPILGNGPIAGLRRAKKRLACGSGCGEVYWDEWASTPPYCADPCDDCGNYFGSQNRCRPCRRLIGRGMLREIYGKRFCEGCGEHFASCGCDGGYGYGEPAHSGGCDNGCCGGHAQHKTFTRSKDYQLAGRSDSAPPAPPKRVVRQQTSNGQSPRR